MNRVLGMARYEFLMHWRRRPLRVVALTLLFCASAGAVIVSADPDMLSMLTAGQMRDANEMLITLAMIPVVLMLMIFVFPVVMADSAPIDAQTGASELLAATPLMPAQYLAGKLVGLWAAGGAAAFGVMAITAVLWAVTLGAYSIGVYLEIWIVAAAIMALNGGLALLIGATQPTRARAAVLVIAFMSLAIVFGTGSLTDPTFPMLISPARLTVVNTYMINASVTDGSRLISMGVLIPFAAGVVQIGIAFAAVLAWRRQSAS
jgi:hypothetical protein